MTPKLSIITPVYNAAKTVEQSFQSIRCSRSEDVEIVFVDDGCTDGTGDLLASFIEMSPFRCKLIHQENKGVAAARNTGLDNADGEYIVFLDADDRLNDGALDCLLPLLETGADIIGWDWSLDNNGSIRPLRQSDFSTPSEAIANIMSGIMRWNLWLFSIKRKLIETNDLSFIPGADMGEDMQFVLKAFASATNVIQLHEVLYLYNTANPASISSVLSEKRRKEMSINLGEMESFFRKSQYSELFNRLYPQLLLYIKRPLLIGTSIANYRIWTSWFPETNSKAGSYRVLPFHTRLLQTLACHRMYILVWLYNIIVYKFLYLFLFR